MRQVVCWLLMVTSLAGAMEPAGRGQAPFTELRVRVPADRGGVEPLLALSGVRMPKDAAAMRVFVNPKSGSEYLSEDRAYLASVSNSIQPGDDSGAFVLPFPKGALAAGVRTVRIVLVPITTEGKILVQGVVVKRVEIRSGTDGR